MNQDPIHTGWLLVAADSMEWRLLGGGRESVVEAGASLGLLDEPVWEMTVPKEEELLSLQPGVVD